MVRANENNDTDPSSPAFKRLERDFRKLLLEVGTVKKKTAENARGIRNLGNTINVLQSVSNNLPPAPAANMLWNGDLGHSVNSWNDTSYVTTDKSKECAWYFSHHLPFVPVSFTNADVGTDYVTIIAGHGTETGTAVRIKSSLTVPSGGASPIVAGTTYYAYCPDFQNFQLASTQALALAGTPDKTWTTGTGTGTIRLEPALVATDARTSALNQTIKRTEGTHSTYDKNYSRWDATRGIAQFNTTRSIDTPIPSNFLEPGQTARIGMRISRRHQYISIPDTALMYAGIVDNTVGQGDFLQGSTGFAAAAVIDGAPTIERRYRMFVQTDRGYSILSPEIVVANAPDSGSYDSENFVAMEWLAVAGYQNIEIWEYFPSTGDYYLLQEISSGTSSYIDNGTRVRTDVAYPTATSTVRKTVFYTREGELSTLLDYDPNPWTTAYFPAYVPDNYAKGATTDRQWMRLGMTVAADFFVSGEVGTSASDLVLPAAILETATYGTGAGSSYAGLSFELLDVGTGAIVTTGLIVSVTDDSTLVTDQIFAIGPTLYALRIIGGGFHAVLIDQIHMCFQNNVSFAPNPIDARVLQPVAAPSVGTGGTGGGTGGGGGIGGCVPVDELIEYADESYGPAGDLKRGNYIAGENMRPNLVEQTKPGLDRTRLVKWANGIEKRCTDSHPLRMTFHDEVGTPLLRLRVGDRTMTNLDGRDELSRIVDISPLSLYPEAITHPLLSGGHWYRAGRWKPTTFWQRLFIKLGLMKPKRGTAYGHNNKPPIF